MAVKISVIVPTYKRPQLLLKCLHALTSQVFDKGNYEIIVVSDGPDNETSEMITLLLTEGMPFILYHSLPEKKGPAAARNAGWKLAKGELIAFTDDDCIPAPDWLKNAWELYATLNLIEVAFSGRTTVPVSSPPTDYELNISRLSQCEFITANCMCTRKSLEAVGGFDEHFTCAWREDSDLHFKFIEHSIPIFKADSAAVTHPVRKAPWGVSLLEQKKSMFNALLYKKYPRLYREKIQAGPPWHYYFVVVSFLMFTAGSIAQLQAVLLTGALMWLTGSIRFIMKRLKSTSRTASHISEMVFTSFLIPFLSVYWRLYGAWRFRVFFI